MTSEQINQIAEAIFLAAWPKDKWDRYKDGDVVKVLYLKLAVAAIEQMEKINE